MAADSQRGEVERVTVSASCVVARGPTRLENSHYVPRPPVEGGTHSVAFHDAREVEHTGAGTFAAHPGDGWRNLRHGLVVVVHPDRGGTVQLEYREGEE